VQSRIDLLHRVTGFAIIARIARVRSTERMRENGGHTAAGSTINRRRRQDRRSARYATVHMRIAARAMRESPLPLPPLLLLLLLLLLLQGTYTHTQGPCARPAHRRESPGVPRVGRRIPRASDARIDFVQHAIRYT